MRRFYFCSADGIAVLRSENFADDYLVPSNMGGKRADSFVGSAKSSLEVPGAINDDGKVTYTAWHGGVSGNTLFVEHTSGVTGPGNESRALDAAIDLNDVNGISVVLTFGTTSGGFTLIPSSQQVADVINGKAVLQDFITATAGGTGTGSVDVLTPTYLGDGADDGDWRKFNDVIGSCRRVNTVEVV